MRLDLAGLAIATLAFATALHAEEPTSSSSMDSPPGAAPAGQHAMPANEEAPESGTWKFAADFLYVQPTVGNTFFAIAAPTMNTVPNGDRENNDLDYHPGFRVAGGYQLPGSGRELELAYTRLGLDQSETIRGSFLWATLGTADFTSSFENYAGSAASQLDLTYERIEAHFAQPMRVSDLDLSLLFGVEYASVRLREEYRYSSPADLGQIGETLRTWGIGPQAGLGLGYEILAGQSWLPGALSVDMVSSASLLVSQVDSRASNSIDGVTLLNVTDEDTSRIVPAFHTRLGFTWGMPVMGIGAAVSIGYQLDTYLGELTAVTYPDDVADGMADTDTDDFDVQGMYVSAALHF